MIQCYSDITMISPQYYSNILKKHSPTLKSYGGQAKKTTKTDPATHKATAGKAKIKMKLNKNQSYYTVLRRNCIKLPALLSI